MELYIIQTLFIRSMEYLETWTSVCSPGLDLSPHHHCKQMLDQHSAVATTVDSHSQTFGLMAEGPDYTIAFIDHPRGRLIHM